MMTRLRLRAFLLGFALIRWALRDKKLDAEVSRMLRYQEIMGNIEGFQGDLS